MIKNNKHISAEEKLLHLIENKDPSSGPIIEGPDDLNINTAGKLSTSFGPLSRIAFKKPSLADLNKMFMGVLIVLSIAAVVNFIVNNKAMSRRFQDFITKEGSLKDTGSITLNKDVPALDQYISDTEKNNPFHLLPVLVKPKVLTKQESSLMLVGIFWDDRPQAVIEDTASNKNYMVYEGDALEEYSVKKITNDSVHLISENGEKILR